jgi:hypothetical protein
MLVVVSPLAYDFFSGVKLHNIPLGTEREGKEKEGTEYRERVSGQESASMER